MNQNETNFELLNKVKNCIVYSTPQINLEDINSINLAEFGSFPKEWITSMPLKVVASWKGKNGEKSKYSTHNPSIL